MAFQIKRNDLRPRFRVQLTQTDPSDDTSEISVDLTSATGVRFVMKSGITGAAKVDAPAEFIDPANGVVEYTWQGTDTDTAGDYNVEIVVNWGSEPQTFPSVGYFTASINDSLT